MLRSLSEVIMRHIQRNIYEMLMKSIIYKLFVNGTFFVLKYNTGKLVKAIFDKIIKFFDFCAISTVFCTMIVIQ